METKKIDYALSPTLLDSYLYFQKINDDESFTAIFNKINKVYSEQTELQQKGSEFEKIVSDKIIELNSGIKSLEKIDDLYHTDNFSFKADLVDKFGNKLRYAKTQQELISAIIPSSVGNIKLYGFVDFGFPEMDADLKTTSQYKLLKYQKNCQHKSYSLIRKLNGVNLKKFYYLVTDFERYYQEAYIPNEKMYRELMEVIFEFIAFINYFKGYINNNKIFGEA